MDYILCIGFRYLQYQWNYAPPALALILSRAYQLPKTANLYTKLCTVPSIAVSTWSSCPPLRFFGHDVDDGMTAVDWLVGIGIACPGGIGSDIAREIGSWDADSHEIFKISSQSTLHRNIIALWRIFLKLMFFLTTYKRMVIMRVTYGRGIMWLFKNCRLSKALPAFLRKHPFLKHFVSFKHLLKRVLTNCPNAS